MRRLTLLLAAAAVLAGCGGDAPQVRERPARALAPLPAPVRGEPLYPRPDGRLYFGLTDNALNEETATPAEVAAIAAGAGASFVRLDMFWPGVDRNGRYDWARYDQQYAAFSAAGVRPLWTVLSTPRHAAKPGARCDGNFCSGEPRPGGRQALRAFAGAAAERYPLAAGFEYRNEPNLDAAQQCSEAPSWHVTPAEYAAGLTAFAEGIRTGNRAMRVIGGALSDCPLADRPFRYLAAILPVRDSMDAISWHPYDDEGSPFEAEAARFDEIVPAGMRVIAGEVGFDGGDDEQRDRLLAQYRRIERMERYDAFAGFVTVEKRDAAKRDYGWVRMKNDAGVFEAKPVYCGFRELLGGIALPRFISCG